MTTAADLVATTQKRYLRGGAQPQKNKLAIPYTAGSSSITLSYDLRSIQAGATLSIGLNVFYVWSVDTSTKTAVVDGGQDGSTDANAVAGSTVYVNSGYSDFEVFNALNEELAALSAPANGLFKVGTVQFPYSASTVGYDLAGVTDLQQILEVRYAEPDRFGRTPRLDSGDYRLERNTTPGEYSSGLSIKLLRGGYPGRTVTVLYRSGFTQFAATSDNLTVTGLPSSAFDLPPMGAALRLLVGREIRRNDITTQGDTRRAEEVGAGAEAASWRGLAGLRAQRINEEVSNLQAQYPARTF